MDANFLLEAIGYVAAFCTTSSQFPQAYKIIKTNDTRSISLIMYLVFMLGVIFWLIYGIMGELMPMIVANVITIVPVVYIFTMKCKHLVKDRRESQKLH